MRLLVILASILLLTACSTISPRVYNGSHSNPSSISVLYNDANNVHIEQDWEVGIETTKVVDSQGKVFPSSGRYELKPGKYTLYARWYKVVNYGDNFKLVKGDQVKMLLNGLTTLETTAQRYKIVFYAKPGMTYVLDADSTAKYTNRSPNKICLTEEAHNASGALGGSLNPDIRWQSKNAKTVACSL